MDEAKGHHDSLQIQERDFALLRGLFECRIMTAGHVAALFFDGKREYTKKRLQKLKAAGLIGERKRRVNEPSILFLTRGGFAFLKSNGHLDGLPALGKNTFDARANVSQLTLRHELEIMDVKAAFHSALRNAGPFSLAAFSTWPLLYQFETSVPGTAMDVLVKPDGFIRIQENELDDGLSEHTFFLEVDRSSETQDTLVNRAVCYLEYYRTGGFAIRNGASATDFKEFPFRVLMVMKTAERRNNTAARLAHNNPPILTQVLLTTLTEATADPLGPIWIQPADYREAVTGTPFEKEQPGRHSAYHRRPEREAFVESRIQKRRFLES